MELETTVEEEEEGGQLEEVGFSSISKGGVFKTCIGSDNPEEVAARGNAGGARLKRLLPPLPPLAVPTVAPTPTFRRKSDFWVGGVGREEEHEEEEGDALIIGLVEVFSGVARGGAICFCVWLVPS